MYIRHDSESGSTILNVVLAMAVASALSLAYANLYASVRKVQAKVDFLNTVSQIQRTIANTVNDSNSWNSTIGDSTHNSSMSCLTTKSCTTASGPAGFVLWPAGESAYTSLANAVYDGTSASSGYTLSGQPCSTFAAAGNSACPIHVNMTWQTAGCSPSPCQAQVSVTADVLFRPGATASFGSVSETRYTLTFQQNSLTSNDPCATAAPAAESTTCASPPYVGDTLVCTSTGYRCGQVYH